VGLAKGGRLLRGAGVGTAQELTGRSGFTLIE
jgi:hypothetical protein